MRAWKSFALSNMRCFYFCAAAARFEKKVSGFEKALCGRARVKKISGYAMEESCRETRLAGTSKASVFAFLRFPPYIYGKTGNNYILTYNY